MYHDVPILAELVVGEWLGQRGCRRGAGKCSVYSVTKLQSGCEEARGGDLAVAGVVVIQLGKFQVSSRVLFGRRAFFLLLFRL